MSAPAAQTLEGASGAFARIEGVAGLSVLASDGVRPIDVSRVPGARIVSRAAWRDEATQVVATCAAAPTDRYVEGLEPLIFDQATRLAREALRIETAAIVHGASRSDGKTTSRRSELAGARVDGHAVERVVLDHALGFAGPDRDALLCSAVCAGPAARCEAVTVALEGSLVAPPEPGPLARGVLWAASHPEAAGAIGAIGAIAAAALLVARRPRPPRLDGVPRLVADPSRALRDDERRP